MGQDFVSLYEVKMEKEGEKIKSSSKVYRKSVSCLIYNSIQIYSQREILNIGNYKTL